MLVMWNGKMFQKIFLIPECSQALFITCCNVLREELYTVFRYYESTTMAFLCCSSALPITSTKLL